MFYPENHHFSAFTLTAKVSSLVQSTQSLLLEEQECLTAAKEAQGSIIDLTSQSCRALSPSFTLPCLPTSHRCPHAQEHTQKHTLTEQDVQALYRDV